MTDLTNRSQGENQRNDGVADPQLQQGGILINSDTYEIPLDRIYEAKGFNNMHIEIKNEGGANALTYTIQAARKEYTDLSELVSEDFDKEILADTVVAFGITDFQDIINLTPESTAIRIRVKRTAAGLDTTMGGIVSAI